MYGSTAWWQWLFAVSGLSTARKSHSRVDFPGRVRRGGDRRVRLPQFALLGLFLLSFSAHALDPDRRITQYMHHQWGPADGLIYGHVWELLRDSRGYLVLGTSRGAIRFDGVEFEPIGPDRKHPLNETDVRALAEDSEGRIWFGTYGDGVVLIDGESIRQFTQEDGLPHNVVYDLAWDARNKRLWIATAAGLRYLSDGNIKAPETSADLPTGRYLRVGLTPAGCLWASIVNKGVARICGTEVTMYTDDKSGWTNVYGIESDSSGTVWLATYGQGLIRWQDKSVKRFTTEDGLPNNYVYSLGKDSDGNLWIGMVNGVLVRRQGGEFSSYARDQSNPGTPIYNFLEDGSGNLWMGRLGGTLERLKNGKVLAYTPEEGLPSAPYFGVHEDRQGQIWLGTEGNGIVRIGEDRIATVTAEDGLPTNNVGPILGSGEGGFWMVTYPKGLTYFSPEGEFRLYGKEEGLKNPRIHSIARASDGGVWVGTLEGTVGQFNGGGFTRLERIGKATDKIIRSLLETRDGRIWAGTNGDGLICLGDGNLRIFGKEDGLRSELVYSLHEDRQGTLWIGTKNGGLTRMESGSVVSIDSQHPLGQSSIYSIQEDRNGYLWLGTMQGIVRVDRQRLVKFMDDSGQNTLDMEVFDERDGLPSRILAGGFSPVATMTDDGRLWFTLSTGGVVAIDPDDIPRNENKPRVYIEKVESEEHVVSEGGAIPSDSNDIRVEFTATNLTSPDETRFRYRLAGYDEEWVDAGGRREAFYTNLPHGEYEFHVTAVNEDGVWNREGDRFGFEIEPSFYQTWRFYLIAGLLFVGGIFGVVEWRVVSIQRRRRNLELLVNDRTQKLEETMALLDRQAKVDGLTGVANRRYFEERLEEEWSRAARSGTELSLVMLDIDQFKQFNDHYGHQKGDDCLKAVTRTLEDSLCRGGDMVARYGGEEFMVLLPGTELEGARVVAERMRSAVESMAYPHAASQVAGVVTVSAGVATETPTATGSREELIRQVDIALYNAKRAGRNQVSGAMPENR